MISDQDFAKRVLSEADECFKKFNELLRAAKRDLPGGEFVELRRGVGLVLGYLYTDVQVPIHQKHPELKPPELRRKSGL